RRSGAAATRLRVAPGTVGSRGKGRPPCADPSSSTRRLRERTVHIQPNLGRSKSAVLKFREFSGGIASMRAKKGARWGLHACFRDREFAQRPPKGRRCPA